jgi:hypothetical protein
MIDLDLCLRNHVATNNAENNGESNNQEGNPPPTPPLTLEQVLAMQTQMLQTMKQTLVNLHAQPQAPPPLRDRLGDFQRTMPPHEVDTNEKKQESFLNGLNDGLAYALEARDFENFQGMVNKALVIENRRVIERKRKLVCQHQPSSSSTPRVATSLAGPVFHPA